MKTPILHVIDSLAVGGAEKLLVGVVNGLEGFDHHVMVLHGPEALRSEITAPYQFTNLHCGSFSAIFAKSKKALRYIRENKIALVHSHLYEANLLARLATPRSVPLLNSIHAISSLASYKVNRMSLYLEKLTYRKRQVLIAVSRAVLDDFDKWVGVKGDAHVLYNFIEGRFFNPHLRKRVVGNELKLVAVGNLRWQKNYPYVIEAFKRIPKNVQLDIYGQGDLQGSLEKEIKDHQLNIRLMGVRNNLESLLPDYDAFLMSSLYEGQPLSLLEASACGLPAILSDIPVLREVLEEAALYFDLNDPQSLVSCINDIMAHKYDLNRLAEAGARMVSEFAKKDDYMKKLAGIYNHYLH